MVDEDDSGPGHYNSMGAENTQISPVVNRLSNPNISIELARYRNISSWKPKLGDFIIWHGWFSRWYGIINGIQGGQVTVIKENLPKLLFTIPQSEWSKNNIDIKVEKIRSSRGGEFHILQDNVWYVDD